MKKTKLLSILLIIIMIISVVNLPISWAEESQSVKVDLSNLKWTVNGNEEELKKYTQDQFEEFLADYKSNSLPEIYVTEFLFDGVGMYAPYDLDDFMESEDGNDYTVEPYSKIVVNINTTGNIELSGELSGGMIAVNTNDKTSDINIILNGVKIDTKDSEDKGKKCPAIYVYNKDVTYTDCKVTIKTVAGTNNVIEGGKLKKVSLIGSDELSSYTSKYSGDMKTAYETYTNYYGVYTTDEIANILFATVQADSEDLADGDPYYFYKASGAISSDIDLYFEGEGYLSVTSKNKEGIETKGDLTLAGGTGDYYIFAEDDCLNTTTDSKEVQSAHNTLTIDVKSLVAIVDPGEDSDEGDAIDSNGELIINGGNIIALAHPGQDAGIDSETGTYINGGTVLATGDMFDAISDESKQQFIVLSFQNSIAEDEIVALLNSNDEMIMAYKTDRKYTTLVYSSSKLENGSYYLYKDGNVEGTDEYGFYAEGTYTKGTQQGYASTGAQSGMQGGPGDQGGQFPGGMTDENQGERPTRPDGTEAEQGERPEGGPEQNGERPEGELPENNNGEEPPALPDGENQNGNFEPQTESSQTENNEQTLPTISNESENEEAQQPTMPNNQQQNNTEQSDNQNNEFVVNGISNQFSGIQNYSGSSQESSNGSANNSNLTGTDSTTANTILPKTGIAIVIGFAIIGAIALSVYFYKKNKYLNLK